VTGKKECAGEWRNEKIIGPVLLSYKFQMAERKTRAIVLRHRQEMPEGGKKKLKKEARRRSASPSEPVPTKRSVSDNGGGAEPVFQEAKGE